MNDRVRGGISTVPTGQFGTGRSTAGGSERRNLSWRTHDRGKSSRGPDAGGVVGKQPAGSGVHVAAWQERNSASSRRSRPAAAPQSFDRQVSQMRQSMQRNGAGAGQSFSRGTSQNSSRPSQEFALRRQAARRAVRTPAPAAASTTVRRRAAGRARAQPNAMSGRAGLRLPTVPGWRRFSDSNPAQRDGGMNRPSGMSPAGMSSNVPRPGNSTAAGGFDQRRRLAALHAAIRRKRPRLSGSGEQRRRHEWRARSGPELPIA